MASTIIPDLVDGECIISAALMGPDGFTIERTSNEFKPTSMMAIMDLNPNSSLITVVAEEHTVVISRLETGHSIVIQCPNGSNIGKARLLLSNACKAILPFL